MTVDIPFLDGLTVDEYFNPESTTKKDVGRPMVIKEKRQTFKGAAWITEECPLSLVDELIPILDILCNFNDIPWFDSLRQMLKLIPKGFPIRLDVPLFYVLTARVTFQNINSADGDYCSKGNTKVSFQKIVKFKKCHISKKGQILKRSN